MAINAETKLIGRRNFLKAAAVLPAVGAVAYKAQGIGPVKTGIVGTGLEGRILITACDPSYLYLSASCDIRPDNRALGHELMKNPKLGHHPAPKVYDNYEDLLNDREIEAVIVAVPLHLHAPFAIQALKAGKHVFVEKAMAYSLEECSEMTRLARQKGLTLQVGHQRFYNPLYWETYKMLKEGLLGDVYHIRALWHRNTDWNYWTYVWDQAKPEMQKALLAMDPQKYGYPDLQRLVNWRWYDKTSHGLWTELCSHQIAVTNWFFNSSPTAVYATGGRWKNGQNQDDLYRKFKDEFDVRKQYNDPNAKTFADYCRLKKHYEQDDRSISDHIYAIYEYPNGRTVTYSCIQSSSVDNYYEEIMGTRGTVLLSNENESYLFWEPGWDETKAKKVADDEKEAREAKTTQIEVVKEDAAESAFSAHVSPSATVSGGASGMSPTEPYRYELRGFAHTIRSNAANLCDGERASKALMACLYGKKSLEAKQRLEIPANIVARA